MNWNKLKFKKLLEKLNEIFKTDEARQLNIYYESIKHSNILPFEINSLLFVKGVADYYKGKIVGIMPYNKQNELLLAAMGGELDNIEESPSLLERLEIYFRLFTLLLSCHTGDDVGQIHCRNIKIGDIIYSDIVRNHYGVCTLEKANLIKYWNTYKKAITWTVMYDNKFAKNPPYVYIMAEVMYCEGVLYRVAAKHGAKIGRIPFLSNPYVIHEFGEGYEYNIDKLFYEQICKMSKKLAKDMGKDEDVNFLLYGRPSRESDMAFDPNKQMFSRDELIHSLKLDPKKKNIFIFLHCFSDDSYHGNVSIYRDYYCWYIDTINIVKNIDNVNWIFREHPMAADYGDEEAAKRIFDKNKNENIYWMSKEYNGKNIPLVADAVITVSGTAGVEYSALGIPCIVLGKPYYSYFGYTINVRSRDKYLDILNKMDKIRKLTDDKTAIAKNILNIYMKGCRPFYTTEVEGLVGKFRTEYYQGIDYKKAESDFLDGMLDMMEETDIKDSRIYQFGLNIFKEDLS